MGRDGWDNLQTCALNEHSPLPQPKTEGVISPPSSSKKSNPRLNRYADVKIAKDWKFLETQKLVFGICAVEWLQGKRPANGYHPAGKGIHDFMGTCTIGTISQHPGYKE